MTVSHHQPAKPLLNTRTIALLRCPECLGSVVLEALDGGQQVRCERCGRRYPVVEGLPILIRERSLPE